MARVINTNSPGKRRNQLMRTIAEILRRLSQKPDIDDDVKDMVALIVYCLREIDETVEESVQAWEKRGYWKKADDFQNSWWWASMTAKDVEQLIREERWDDLPDMMIKLFPHFSDIEVSKMTRKESLWAGAYRRLMESSDGEDA